MKKFQMIAIAFVLTALGAFELVQDASAEFVPYPQSDPSLPVIQLQLILRDPDGNLVAYIEPTTLYISSVPQTHAFLDTKNGTKFTENGKTFEEFEYGYTDTFGGDTAQYATYQQGFGGNAILIFRHDGYLASQGDTLEVNWKIVRLIS